MFPHLGVHGRGQNHRGMGSQDCCRQQVIGPASSQAGHEISCCGGNQHRISLLSLGHVVDLIHPVKKIRSHRVTAQGLQGRLAHKLEGSIGRNSYYLVACLRKKTKEHGRLVGSDAPSNANNYTH